MPTFIPTENPGSTGLKYLFPATLILLWTVHLVDTELRWIPEPFINENRQLAERPTPDIELLDPFPAAYENYYNDHFAWRKHLIKWNAKLSLVYGKSSTFPDKVVIGKENWLFKTGEQLELYQGTRRLRPQELEKIAADLQARSDSVEARGGKYYLSFAPLKHHIYSKYLPDNVTQSPQGATVDQLLTYLRAHTDISYINLYQPIREWVNQRPDNDTLLYYRTDHHWTNQAGLIVINTLLGRLREDFPAIPDFDPKEYPIRTMEIDGLSLAQLLGLEEKFRDQWSVFTSELPLRAKRQARTDILPPPSFGYPDEYAIAYRQIDSSSTLPSIFINRESFANNLKAIIPDYFSRTFLLFDAWQHNFNGRLYYQEESDIYLQLIWEGFLLNLLDDREDNSI